MAASIPTNCPPQASRDERERARSRVYSIKVPAALIDTVDATVKRFVWTRWQAPITRNEFIRRAIEEKLDKLRRSAQWRRGRGSRRGTLRYGGNTALAGNASGW